MYVKYLNGQVHRTQISGCWGCRGEGSYCFLRTEFLFGVTEVIWNATYSGGGAHDTAVELSGAELEWLSAESYVTNVLPPLFKVVCKQSYHPLCHTSVCSVAEPRGQRLPADLLGAEAL